MPETEKLLDRKEAFEILKFYEETAGKVKGRTWTISSWLLSMNSGLIGFCFSVSETTLFDRQNSIISASVAGIVLSALLAFFILAQGIHLREYMDHQISVLKSSELGKTIVFGVDKGSIPWFCWCLITLAMLFIFAFFIISVLTLCDEC